MFGISVLPLSRSVSSRKHWSPLCPFRNMDSDPTRQYSDTVIVSLGELLTFSCCAIQVPNTKSQAKIHTPNQAIFVHVQNEWGHHPWKSTYPWKMLFPNFNYAIIFWALRKWNFKQLRTIKRTQWKLLRKRKDRSLSEFRPSRLNQHAREGTR